jgi:hypothetical protein
VELRIDIDDQGSEAEDLATQTAKLRRTLLELDVDDVRHVTAGPAPDGTRAVDVLAVGSLLVALAKAPQLVSSMAQVLSAWVSTRNGRSVTVEIDGNRLELTGVTRDDQQRMMRLFEREVAD